MNFVASPITYSASGKVTEKYTGHSVKGVSITFSHGHDEVVTGEDGTWRKSGLAGEVKITPRKDGWVFEPPTLAVSKETNGVDFVGWRGAEEAVMQATCGHFHTLAVGDRGTVWAWGLNESGQLGSGETTPYETIPILVEGLPSIKMVVAGSYFSLALDFDGRVWAWGDNRYGQLGISPAETGTHLSATPLLIDSIDDVVFIAAGAYHSLAIRGDGSVWAWGSNSHGQLGDVTGAHSAVPVEVVGLTDVISVAALSNYSLALKSDGTVWIWGMSQTVRPGLGGPDRNDIPVQVTSIEDVIGIAAGHGHSLALKSDGTVWSWGNNSDGQLGNGTYTSSTTPVQVDGLHDVTAIAAGHGHSLAACSDGSAWAWGDNSFGQLGIGVGPGKRCNPVQVADFDNVMGLGAGWMHSLALTQDGELWAWGLNYSGELGDGTCTNRPLPVPVAF